MRMVADTGVEIIDVSQLFRHQYLLLYPERVAQDILSEHGQRKVPSEDDNHSKRQISSC